MQGNSTETVQKNTSKLSAEKTSDLWLRLAKPTLFVYYFTNTDHFFGFIYCLFFLYYDCTFNKTVLLLIYHLSTS